MTEAYCMFCQQLNINQTEYLQSDSQSYDSLLG